MKQQVHVPTLPPTSPTPRGTPSTSVDGHQEAGHATGNVPSNDAWNARTADVLSAQAGVRMTAEHRNVIAAVRLDFAETGEMPTLLRASRITGLDPGRLFELFHNNPAVTMAHIAGLVDTLRTTGMRNSSVQP